MPTREIIDLADDLDRIAQEMRAGAGAYDAIAVSKAAGEIRRLRGEVEQAKPRFEMEGCVVKTREVIERISIVAPETRREVVYARLQFEGWNVTEWYHFYDQAGRRDPERIRIFAFRTTTPATSPEDR